MSSMKFLPFLRKKYTTGNIALNKRVLSLLSNDAYTILHVQVTNPYRFQQFFHN